MKLLNPLYILRQVKRMSELQTLYENRDAVQKARIKSAELENAKLLKILEGEMMPNTDSIEAIKLSRELGTNSMRTNLCLKLYEELEHEHTQLLDKYADKCNESNIRGAVLYDLSEAIEKLSGEFDKPVSDGNTPKWLRLNEVQKRAKELVSR